MTRWCRRKCPLPAVEVRCPVFHGHEPPHDYWTVVRSRGKLKQVRVQWWDGGLPLHKKRGPRMTHA